MATQNKTVILNCECGYKTPPPECCNGGYNIYGYYEPPSTQKHLEKPVGLANLTGNLDY